MLKKKSEGKKLGKVREELGKRPKDEKLRGRLLKELEIRLLKGLGKTENKRLREAKKKLRKALENKKLEEAKNKRLEEAKKKLRKALKD